MKILSVTGLFFGDEGKGAVVDAITRRLHDHGYGTPIVVRHNGGSQCGHNVVTPAGNHHTFAQFGSGTFVPGAETFLSKNMLWNPLNLMLEERALRRRGVVDAFQRMHIAESAPIITQFHVQTNRARETARDSRHGSCGEGVGETRVDFNDPSRTVLFAADLRSRRTLERKLNDIRDAKYADIETLGQPLPKNKWESQVDRYLAVADLIDIVPNNFLSNTSRPLIFEGAQGVLLDQKYGFHPYSTWSDTTGQTAFDVLAEANITDPVTHIGVVRSYGTRHGRGPFPTERKNVHVIHERHNGTNEWQGNFRVGHYDGALVDYALRVAAGITHMVITHCDQLTPASTVCIGYEGVSLPGPSDGDVQERQEALTLQLMEATPKYEIHSFLEWAREFHNIPHCGRGYGPNATQLSLDL